MVPQDDIPPVIAAPEQLPKQRTRLEFSPPVFLGLILLAAAIARIGMDLRIPFPRCGFKAVTGLPCAFCGGTRALRSLTHFRFSEAFWLNPLVTIGAFAALGIFVIWVTVPRPLFDRWLEKNQKLPLLPIGLTLVALNWILVIKYLPR